MKIETNNSSMPKLVYKHRLRSGEARDLWLSRILIWIIIVITLFPIFAIVSVSLNKGDSFFSTSLLPTNFTLENYSKVLSKTGFINWMKNTLMVCTSVAVIQLFFSVTGAYAFSRMKFIGRKNGLMALLLLQMFPTIMALPAIIGVAYNMHLMNKYWALILLLAGGSAYSIWLLKGFMDSLPKELDEAAMVDGASHYGVFVKIILPLCKPMLAVIFLFSFINAYSEFFITSALIKDKALQTLPLGFQDFVTNQFSANWTQFSAAAIMATIPVAILFVILQKFIAQGLTAGAVKG